MGKCRLNLFRSGYGLDHTNAALNLCGFSKVENFLISSVTEGICFMEYIKNILRQTRYNKTHPIQKLLLYFVKWCYHECKFLLPNCLQAEATVTARMASCHQVKLLGEILRHQAMRVYQK
jgi:hypothetical protein